MALGAVKSIRLNGQRGVVMKYSFGRIISLLALVLVPFFSFADEGMWTFDNPPLQQWAEKYGFIPDQAWLDHVRLATLRPLLGDRGYVLDYRLRGILASAIKST